RWVHIKDNSDKCVFTRGIDLTHIPVAHGEGRFCCDPETYRVLKENNQIVFTYCDESGQDANSLYPLNPNGAMNDVAAICDMSGRIMGMMPHPERAIYAVSEPEFQLKKELAKRAGKKIPELIETNFMIFKNAVDYVNEQTEAEGSISIPESAESKQPAPETSEVAEAAERVSTKFAVKTKTEAATYADAGVNLELGDDASKILYEAAKRTFENRKGLIGEVIIPLDDFSGLRAVDVSKLPEGSLMCISFDGVGTKVEIAQRMNDHTTIAYDLLAMVCDDAIVRGAEPVLVGTVLDVNSLGKGKGSNIHQVRQLAQGYIAAAREANVAIINGELAELGNISGYGNFNYNWCAGVIWFARRDRLFTGREIQLGDSIVVLEEGGFRSNGISLVRRTFRDHIGEEWHKLSFEGSTLGKHVLTPSRIYSKAMVKIHGGFNSEGLCEIHGIAHITGGGIPGKLSRILRPSGLGAELDNLFEPCKAMQYCQQLGKITDREAYRTWNMGQGMAIITPEPERVIEELERLGIRAKVGGRIILEKKIIIHSKGLSRERLVFDAENFE
ncbi:hypothetical protein COT48_04660, partial [Candidatus Woesearchaeota archaeon CG08_land_8_20_14_0_20_47_9]